MIETNEVLLKKDNNWHHFSKPHQIISTNRVAEVFDLLHKVEALVEQHQWYAAGFVSYEAAPAFDQNLRVLDSVEFPLLWFGLYSKPQIIKDLPAPTQPFEAHIWQPTTKRESYNTSIEKIKEYIAEGLTYQVNYTMRLNSEFSSDAWNFFLHLSQNQNKYAAYINTGRFAICSASPELFFELDGDIVTSRPMKGTTRRGRTTAEDKQQADWLSSSVKNRAENVMIVDMVRNDLGRIAETGSVHVPELFTVEKYPTLFQLTSKVEAKTTASVTDIFAALFPCASITGAPKISTMKVISELENTPRKIYTGSIGYISPKRKAQFNVAIRTALIDKEAGAAEYGVGGGIVWDSTNLDEYNEALLKSKVLTEHPQGFSLLETILWTPYEGCYLLDKHISRLADSTEYFDFPFSEGKFLNLLEEMKPKFSSAQRLRFLLNRHGELTCESKEAISQEKVFKVKLSEKPIRSADAFYFHKTTNREIYPSIEECDDVILYNEKDELTEFTIGNLVVKMNGVLFTPPVSCGLLAGTFRAHLLETGQVQERVIYKSQLLLFEEIYLVNSVRKWVKVEIKNASI